jgi:phosphoglycolate phosphatase/pyrophosphatase PpaX
MSAAVLFDFDGTLNDTWRLYLEAFRRALEPRFGRRLTDDEILALKPSAERRLLLSQVEALEYPAYFDAFIAHYTELHDRLNDGLYVGVSDMLAALRTRGVKHGVVTGKSRRAWDTSFPACRLADFDIVVTDDDVTQPKPSPEGLLTALRHLRVEPASSLYVGDSLLDCHAAQAAGVAFGAALWSKAPAERPVFIATVQAYERTTLFDAPRNLIEHLNAELGMANHGPFTRSARP